MKTDWIVFFQKRQSSEKTALLSERSDCIDFALGVTSSNAISQSALEDLRQTMDQYWAWFLLTTASIEFLIDICIKQNHCPASVKHPFFINTSFGSALPSIGRIDALITCDIWLSVLWIRHHRGRVRKRSGVYCLYQGQSGREVGGGAKKKCWASTMGFYFVGSGRTGD